MPGDVGLVCPQQDREDPRGLRAYAGGLWYLSAKADRQANGDLALGQPSDLPFCADFDGDGTADSGVFRNGEWYVATRGSGSAVDIRFSLGGAGDRPVALNVSGAGNASDRRNIVYGVYRRGVWHLDTRGSGAPTRRTPSAACRRTCRSCFPAGPRIPADEAIRWRSFATASGT